MNLHKNKKRQAEIKTCLEKYKAKLQHIRGVSDLGVGFRFTGKTYTDELTIIIQVKEKYLKQYQEDDRRIPKMIEGIPVNLIPAPIPELLKFNQSKIHPDIQTIAKKRNVLFDKLTGGIRIRNKRRRGFGGTLGAVVYDQDTNDPYGITARHVLLPNRRFKLWRSAPVVQPDNIYNPQAEIGDVFFNKKKKLDCIRFRLDTKRKIDKRQSVLGINGRIKSIASEIVCGAKVFKSGATTGVTYGVIVCESICGNGFIIYPDDDYQLVDGELSLAGDSGAIWLLNDGSMQAVGLHCSGNRRKNIDAELSIAIRMDYVAKYLNIKF